MNPLYKFHVYDAQRDVGFLFESTIENLHKHFFWGSKDDIVRNIWCQFQILEWGIFTPNADFILSLHSDGRHRLNSEGITAYCSSHDEFFTNLAMMVEKKFIEKLKNKIVKFEGRLLFYNQIIIIGKIIEFDDGKLLVDMYNGYGNKIQVFQLSQITEGYKGINILGEAI